MKEDIVAPPKQASANKATEASTSSQPVRQPQDEGKLYNPRPQQANTTQQGSDDSPPQKTQQQPVVENISSDQGHKAHAANTNSNSLAIVLAIIMFAILSSAAVYSELSGQGSGL